MAFEQTFGTAVVRVLENIQQSTADLDSQHAHRARQFLIDAITSLQEEELGLSQATGSWQTSSGVNSYDPSAKLSKIVRRPVRLWYSESSSDDYLYPSEDGIRQVDFNHTNWDVNADADSTYDAVDAWSWFNRTLYITPHPDGDIYLVLRYVVQPIAFFYKYSSGSWTYFYTRNDLSSPTQANNLAIDKLTDTGWLVHAFNLVVALATRDLYLGPYQAKDPKKSLAQSWIAVADKERLILEGREHRAQGTKRLHPYYGPAG